MGHSRHTHPEFMTPLTQRILSFYRLQKIKKLRLFCNFRAIFIGRWLTWAWAYDDRREAHIVCAIYLWAIDEQSVFKNTSSFAVVCAAANQQTVSKRVNEREIEIERERTKKSTQFWHGDRVVRRRMLFLIVDLRLSFSTIFPFFFLFGSHELRLTAHVSRICWRENERKMRKLKVWLNEIRDEKRAARVTQREREWAQSTLFLRRFVCLSHSALFFKPNFQFSSNFPIR